MCLEIFLALKCDKTIIFKRNGRRCNKSKTSYQSLVNRLTKVHQFVSRQDEKTKI